MRELKHVKFVLHTDEYGTHHLIVLAKVDNELHQFLIGTSESADTDTIRTAKDTAVNTLVQKLPHDDVENAIRAAEAGEEGPRVWLQYYDRSSDIYRTHELSDDINKYLETGTWPKKS